MATKDTETPHGTLYEALHAFQASAPAIPLDSTNPHFRSKFASLPRITEIIRPKLAEHGLVWTTLPSHDENGRPTLKYKLAHVTGQSLDGEMVLLLQKQDPQGLGSAITYARRYALLAVLGLVGDDDDDGNRASEPAAPKAVETGIGRTIAGAARAEGLTDKAKALVSSGVWTQKALKSRLVAAGASTTESVSAAMRSLSVEQADELEQTMDTIAENAAKKAA